MLLNFAKKLRADYAKTSDQGAAGLPFGSLTVIDLYALPRYGFIEGIGQVRVEGEGNMVGFSPVTKCVAHGETAWIPTELVRDITLDPFTVTTRGRSTPATPKPPTATRSRAKGRTTTPTT